MTAWPTKGSEPGDHLRLFRIRHDRLINPRTQGERRVVVLETPDWVNVAAITPGRELVLVRQHRFGLGQPTVEIPGGMVDPGEDPLEAARRELREETGYTAPTWKSLGSVDPNPAFHDNCCHHYLALGASLTEAQSLDAGEDIACFTRPLDIVRQMLLQGEIRHSLVITALSRLLDLRTDSLEA